MFQPSVNSRMPRHNNGVLRSLARRIVRAHVAREGALQVYRKASRPRCVHLLRRSKVRLADFGRPGSFLVRPWLTPGSLRGALERERPYSR